jgi:tripartite-type tricarboxylate transporter receptor subunit TctC
MDLLRVKRWLIALLTIVGFAAAAHAETFPNRTIRIIVPYAPGGSIDLTARVIAKTCRTASDRASSWKTSPAPMPRSASKT